MMALTLILLYWLAFVQSALAAFGVTTVGSSLRVDTGAGLVFDVNKYDRLKYESELH
jgi:hypothetical protein